jgi:hypothetical protein
MKMKKLTRTQNFGLVFVVVLAAGCNGAIGGHTGTAGSSGGGGKIDIAPTPIAFTCNPSAPAVSVALPRLSQRQYLNTIHDIVKYALRGSEADTTTLLAVSAVASAMADYPQDDRAKTPYDRFGTYLRMTQDVQDDNIRSSYTVATAVATQLTTSARLGTVVGTCATDTDAANDAECIRSFIATFGMRALRRPLTDDEVTFYRGFYGTSTGIDPAGFADIIAAFLIAPQFLYMVEHGDTAVAGRDNVFNLSPHEVAARLSYQFTQSMPDEQLLAAAADGSLVSDPDVYAAQLDRLMADPRAKATFDEFFFDYFKLFQSDLHTLVALDARNSDPAFRAFAGDNLPSATLGTSMQDDLLQMGRYLTFATGGKFSDLLTTNYSFATSPELAKIYGIAPWDGTSEPPQFPAGQRPGFLTRAAFLTSGMVNTRPIMKGVFIRRYILCDNLPDPPMNASNTPIDTSNKTSRQAVEGITEQDGTSCASCHKTYLNALGFATENFDGLGRLRSEQTLYDAAGNVTAQIPIDNQVIPHVVPGDERSAMGMPDLVNMINESGKAQACFARNYFRFTFRRMDDPASDGCALEQLREKVMTGSLSEAFRDVALTEQFRSRHFE